MTTTLDDDLQSLYAAADATRGEKISVLGVQAQRDALKFHVERAVALDAIGTANSEIWTRQARAGEEMLALQREQASRLATPEQERWLDLYEMHLKIRLGPAIITSTTDAKVINDIAIDSAGMTATVWPIVKAELDKLAATIGPMV